MEKVKAEKTQPGIYHIHIDAEKMSEDLYQFAKHQLHFRDSDFEGSPEGYECFAPKKHMTLKLKERSDFDKMWDLVEDKADKVEWEGYLEGEYLPTDEYIPYKSFNGKPVPFKIERKKVMEEEGFRQTEFHLSMDAIRSDPRLLRELLNSGLMAVEIIKKGTKFIIFTAQGANDKISRLYQSVKDYLINNGGASRCTIKEEQVVKYKLYKRSHNQLPEVLNKVHYS